MSRLLRASILLLLLASCGGGRFSAPRNLDDACAILRERPEYYRAMKATERRWGVPVHVQMATIHQESKFIGNAKTPHRFVLGIIPMGRQSTAYGYSQALDGTWEEYQAETRNRSARRDRISDATDFMGWYMNGTTMSSSATITAVGTDWQIAGTPDINGDGKPDILWRQAQAVDRRQKKVRRRFAQHYRLQFGSIFQRRHERPDIQTELVAFAKVAIRTHRQQG